MDPQSIVNEAEAAYDARDIDRIMELFDPEIVIYWDGRKRADGLAEARTFHEDLYGDHDERQEYEVRKSLRAASGDTIAVEWTATWLEPDGTRHEGWGGEFWTMRDGRLREWHAYYGGYERDDTVGQRDAEYLSLHQNPPTTNGEPTDPEGIVRKAEAAYENARNTGTIEPILELFDEEIVIYSDGQKVAEGLEEAREYHRNGEFREFELRKSLRAVSGDMVAVEYRATWTDSDGTRFEEYGGEFWQLRDGLLVEWHNYPEEYEQDEIDEEADYLSLH